jgi:magnesium-transporting ATPase (P-type)
MILYMLYKNALYTMIPFWFACLSGFSGQPVILEAANQVYNLMFTSLPIGMFAVFDRDIGRERLLEDPRIYRRSSAGQMFAFSQFVRWMFTSLLHSGIIFWVVQLVYVVPDDASGRPLDHWWVGVVVNTCVVLLANLKIAMHMSSWNTIYVFFLCGTLATFPIIHIMYSTPVVAFAGADYTYAIEHLSTSPVYYITVFVAVGACLCFDYAWSCIDELELISLYTKQKFKANLQKMTGASVDHALTPGHQYAPSVSFIPPESPSNAAAPPLSPSAGPPPVPSSRPPVPRPRKKSRRMTGFNFDHTEGDGVLYHKAPPLPPLPPGME